MKKHVFFQVIFSTTQAQVSPVLDSSSIPGKWEDAELKFLINSMLKLSDTFLSEKFSV